MTREEIAKQLGGLSPGHSIGFAKDIVDEVFPPGLEDNIAFIAAVNFASEHQCRMTPSPGEIVFTKSDRQVPRWEMTTKGPRPVIP